MLLRLSLVLAVALLAQPQLPTGRDVTLRKSSDMDWKPPTNLPPGAEYHLLREDPVTHGIQALVKFPSGYVIPSHAHDADETIVVLKGKLWVRAQTTELVLGPSEYALLPAGVEHELAVKGFGSCRIVVTTSGPWAVRKP
ncbi:MAG: cupin domain-containing protein [Elusimicrobia bacterium]|nr:cupin domain-containing protein [Elusimicrobiota bacterium]